MVILSVCVCVCVCVGGGGGGGGSHEHSLKTACLLYSTGVASFQSSLLIGSLRSLTSYSAYLGYNYYGRLGCG